MKIDWPPCRYSASEYKRAFEAIEPRITEKQITMLREQHAAPGRTITAHQLAAAVGLSSYPSANKLYGKLGRLLCDEMGCSLLEGRNWWKMLSAGIDYGRAAPYEWVMHPPVAEALEELGWVERIEDQSIITDDVDLSESEVLYEGAIRYGSVISYARNRIARAQCVSHYGHKCSVCEFQFDWKHGEIGRDFIEVHHIYPISSSNKIHQIDPISDLRPIYPNCHRMIHRRSPPFTINEMRNIIHAQATKV